MSRTYAIGIVSATGIAGQQFVVALQRHPWLRIARRAASERSAGKRFGEALRRPANGRAPLVVRRGSWATTRRCAPRRERGSWPSTS
jgi:N-acetyl-gamma-glutamylphosphate reductase